MAYTVEILPGRVAIQAEPGANLLSVLRDAQLAPEAPCGGHGTCKKCTVTVNGKEQLACQTEINADMTVSLPSLSRVHILETGIDHGAPTAPRRDGYLLAIDIGTTTVVCYLLDGETGEELAHASMLNPQSAYGADVISRIQAALRGEMNRLTEAIRTGLTTLIRQVCDEAKVPPSEIVLTCIVANPAMQQLFLGISPGNLATVPFAPVITEAKIVPAKEYLPLCESAQMMIVPDVSGYVGADTVGCVLSTRMYASDKMTLMVDIGTNGEMVLGNKHRMTACSTAAGPALEGANIRFGMRGAEGAIDHVWMEDGAIRCSVIGGGTARGICGSGLIDAVAVLLESGLINRRGRIQSLEEVDGQRVVWLTERICLTQEDIREVQLAKGAIAAGIALMAKQLDIEQSQIDQVLLAGAFGSFLRPESACRIGLLPPELLDKIVPVGNAAGSGAKRLVCDERLLEEAQKLVEKIEFIELADLPDFRRCFSVHMGL